VSSNNRLNFIPDDGYTEQGFIKADHHLHGELRFKFRPVLVERRSQHLAKIEDVTGDEFDRVTAKIVNDHLKEWDLKDAKGEVVEITPKWLLRLKPQLFVRLHSIIIGTDTSDTDPKWKDDVKDEHTDQSLESALSKTDVGSVRQGASEKN